jgi:hypothetical protein
MRFYAIKIDGAPSAFQAVNGPVAGAQFSSVVDMRDGKGFQNDPGALRCMLRIEMRNIATVLPNSFVRLYGVDLQMLKQASNLQDLPIEVYAGFWPGLPLATEEAPYAGAIYCGTIWQAFGNWEGVDMTLDLLLSAGNSASGRESPMASTSTEGAGAHSGFQSTGGQRLLTRQRRSTGRHAPLGHGVQATPRDLGGIVGGIASGDIGSVLSSIASSFGISAGWGSTPANLIHNWQPGEQLSNSIRRTLTQAFPWCTIDVRIASLLTNIGAQDSGFYQSIEQYMGFIKQTSVSLMSGSQGAAGTMSSLVSALAQGSQDAGLQTLADALKAAGQSSPGSDTYRGIQAFIRCQRIIVTDNNPVNGLEMGPTLKFEELIGQPTWIAADTITFMTPMRADIYPPLLVTLPQALQTVAPGAGRVPLVAPSMSINFSGPCQLTQVTYNGDSRHPEGSSWALQCVAYLQSPASQASQYPDSSSFVSFPTAIPSGPSGPHPAPGPHLVSGTTRTMRRFRERQVRKYGRQN